MKILIINNGHSSKYFPELFYELSSLKEIDCRIVSNFRGKISFSLIYRIFNKLRLPIDFTSFNRRVLNETYLFDPSQIICIKPNNIYPKTLRKIQKFKPSIKLILWTGDNMNKPFNSSLYYHFNLKYFRGIIISNRKYFNDLLFNTSVSKKKLFFLEKGFDSKKHYHDEGKKQKYDVVFIGSYERQRFIYLEFIAKKGIKVHVFGNNWNLNVKEKNLVIHGHEVIEEEFREVICSSKICLNFLRQKNEDVITSRTFEIPATGGFMLAQRTKFQKLYFEEDKEAVYFDSKNDLLTKINFYLKNSDIRNKIRKAGLKKSYQNDFSLKKRSKELFDLIKQI